MKDRSRSPHRRAPRVLRRVVYPFRCALILCLLALPACVTAGQAGAETGAVEGLVRYEGRVPPPVDVDNEGRRVPVLELNPANDGLRHVIAYLEAVDESPSPLPVDEAEVEATVDQYDLRFVPRITTARVGQSVVFKNSDSENHNVRVSAQNPRNAFNIVTGPSGDYVKNFSLEPATTPVRLSCDIHPWMRGWVYVFDHSRFATTDSIGRYRIDHVPPGDYTLVVAQPDAGLLSRVRITIALGQTATRDITFTREDISPR